MRMRFVAQVERFELVEITIVTCPLHCVQCLICWCGSDCESVERTRISYSRSATLLIVANSARSRGMSSDSVSHTIRISTPA